MINIKILKPLLCILFTILFLITGCSDPTKFDPRKMNWPDSSPKIFSVTGGAETSLALDQNGFVWTWGSTSFDNWKGDDIKGAVPVWNEDGTHFGNIKKIECSSSTCYAIDEQGQLWAWGGDFRGELGTSPPRNTIYPAPITLSDGSPFDQVVSISGGSGTAVAVKENGTVWAWGDSTGGVLGVNEKIWRADERLFVGLDSLKRAYLNQQYGVKELTGSPYPMQIFLEDGSPIITAQTAAANSYHVLIFNKMGDIWGWGSRLSAIWPEYIDTLNYGGDYNKTRNRIPHIAEKSTASDRAAPAKIKYIETAQTFSIAVLDDGTVLTWGSDMNGSLGHGYYYDDSPPERMRDTRDLRDKGPNYYDLISNGPILNQIKDAKTMNHGTILLTEDGRVFYQGSDINGNGIKNEHLDTDSITPENIPILTPVSHENGTPFTNVKSIGSDSWYTAFLIDENNEVWAWGSNLRGKIGDNTSEDRLFPVKVKFYKFDKKIKDWVEY